MTHSYQVLTSHDFINLVFLTIMFFLFNNVSSSGPTQDEVIAESEKISRPEPEIKRFVYRHLHEPKVFQHNIKKII